MTTAVVFATLSVLVGVHLIRVTSRARARRDAIEHGAREVIEE